MKSASVLATAAVAAAADYSDFTIPDLKTNQPNGDKFGYTWIEFNVTSQNGESPATSWCQASWGDDYKQTPIDQWLPCTTQYLGTEQTGVAFKLTKQLQIGDFSLALQQNLTETTDGSPVQTILTTDPYHFSNTTADSSYNCTINPYDDGGYHIHWSGQCSTTAPLNLPVTDAAAACQHATVVSLAFPVQVRTEYGDSVYIVGSIPELGNWDLSRAVPLNADSYTSEPNGDIWTGGNVKVAAGTTFEWKIVQQNADGSWLWECGENWVSSVDAFTCGEQTIGSDPTWMRCGNH